MTITQMRYFQQVCRHQTVTRAASALHVSQPSISNAIRELEEELGVRLFHRVKLRLSLTEEGDYFLTQVEDILSSVDTLTAHMQDLGNKHNQIRLGVPPMIGTFLFPAIFDSFHAKYPEIEIQIEETGSLKIRELLLQEKLDLAIVTMDESSETHYQAQRLLSTELLFCVNANHPYAQKVADGATSEDISLANTKKPVLSLTELADEPIILFKDDFYVNTLLKDQFARQNLTPQVLLSSSQLYTIKALVKKGQAGAFLFREIAAMEPDLVGIPLAPPLKVNVCLIWKKDKKLYGDTTRLIQFIRSMSLR